MWYYKDAGKRGKYTRVLVAVAVCERCGIEFSSGMACAAKYCPDCQASVYREKNAERQRRFRERMKNKIKDAGGV